MVHFVIGRKTTKKRMRAKMLAIKLELRKNMHDPIARTGAWMKQMLQGHLNYFAVSGNDPSLWWYFNKVKRPWLSSLKRRSPNASVTWEKFIRLIKLSANQKATPATSVTASTPKPEGGAPCVRNARRDLCGLRLASALKSAVCDDGRGKA
jgi:hypothetical protein